MENFLSKELKAVLEVKYQDMDAEDLWKSFLDVNEEVEPCFIHCFFSGFYDSLIETLFISNEIKKKTFIEKEGLLTSLKFNKEYETLRGNKGMALWFETQLIYLQKLAY